MEASNGQIHHRDEQPAEEKLIVDTDPGIGAYPPLLLISSLSTSFHLQGGPMVASPTSLGSQLNSAICSCRFQLFF